MFSSKFKSKHQKSITEDIGLASEEWVRDVFPGTSPSWNRIALLKEHWRGPIVLKGIQHVEDAKLALKAGCDGIIVSNHGGRSVSSRERYKLTFCSQADNLMEPLDRWKCSPRLLTL